MLFFILLLFNGCTKAQKAEPVAPLPQITTAYLLEHRIVSDVPKFQEKSIATLPYAIQTFEESYLLYFVARIPDENRSAVFATTKPRYSLLLQRRGHNWRDFTEVHAVKIARLQINSHYSAVREGLFYQEYTIDFTLEQLESVQGS
ncbi:MAG: hypothetical protein MUP09_08310, partial [Thiovulaceae bacterium]|nr:hypothetical protein [Sulfurimonadaceae bacterium]